MSLPMPRVAIVILLVAVFYGPRTIVDALVVLPKHDAVTCHQVPPPLPLPQQQGSPRSLARTTTTTGTTTTSPNSWITSSLAMFVTTTLAATALVWNPISVSAAAGDDVVRGTPLEPAIVQMSAASYPVFTSITDLSPLTNKLAVLVDSKISVPKATKALEQGIDSFLAIPQEKVQTFATTLKSAYDGVEDASSCSANIPIPTASLQKIQTSAVVQGLDSTKLQALSDYFKVANQMIPKTSTNICLPPTSQQLEELWIGQTELMLNMPRPDARAFVTTLSSAISSIPSSEFLSLLPVAKKTFVTTLNPSSDLDVKKVISKFETSAKGLEKSIQSDVRFQQRFNIVK